MSETEVKDVEKPKLKPLSSRDLLCCENCWTHSIPNDHDVCPVCDGREFLLDQPTDGLSPMWGGTGGEPYKPESWVIGVDISGGERLVRRVLSTMGELAFMRAIFHFTFSFGCGALIVSGAAMLVFKTQQPWAGIMTISLGCWCGSINWYRWREHFKA